MEQLSDILAVADQPSTSYGAIPVFHRKVRIGNWQSDYSSLPELGMCAATTRWQSQG